MYRRPPDAHDASNRRPPELTPAVAVSLPSYLMASFFPMDVATAAAGSAADPPADRALTASRNHREAEKRRRERIKSHLDRLRSILSCDPKTDKASLLAMAVERVRELKQRTAEIAQAHFFPTETDEIIVLPGTHNSVSDDSGSGPPAAAVFEASLCCEDRSDLLPELIETLRALRMRTLRAEMATLGGRVRNVLVLAKEKDEEYAGSESSGDGGGLLREALRAVVSRAPLAGGERAKRRKMIDGGGA
ncbi:Transcription factor bHLH106 [Apostasia shenzhenica]|uniref:Transcription factor bHLH106 n=1 Tax=Apostasia shenzhenica TaxID=1088818 RepID=A0A2I0A0T9_9ASPA|nr:Transcription factor bHLH106 [Apostasia shenzhenica]